jgi:hypothetical protein
VAQLAAHCVLRSWASAATASKPTVKTPAAHSTPPTLTGILRACKAERIMTALLDGFTLKIFAFDEFEHERGKAVCLLEPMDVSSVRVIERREHLRLAAETRQAIRIVCDGREQHFDRDVAIQLRVPRAIHLAHPAGAKRRDDFVRTEMNSTDQRHLFCGHLCLQLLDPVLDDD